MSLMAGKGISSVIMTFLLLVVAVIMVASFQGWIMTYMSGIEGQITKKPTSQSTIEGVYGDRIYLSHETASNSSVVSLKINGERCDLNVTTKKGTKSYSLESCTQYLNKGENEIIMESNGKMHTLTFFRKTNTKKELKGGILSLEENWSNGEFSATTVRNGSLSMGYRQEAEGLVLYLPFDKSITGNGDMVQDMSGHNYTGTTKNGVAYANNGIFSKGAYQFGGSSYIDDINDPLDLSKENFTVSAWVKTTGSGQSILSNQVGSGWNGFNFWISGGKLQPVVDWSFSGDYGYIISDTNVATGDWKHVVFVFSGADRSDWQLYIDGTLDTFSESGQDLVGQGINNSIPTTVGRRNFQGGSGYFAGLIDEIRIYNRSLKTNEVEELSFYSFPYKGHYERNLTLGRQVTWEWLRTNLSLSSTANVSLHLDAKDTEGNSLGTQEIQLSQGISNHSLSLPPSSTIRVQVNGSSEELHASWNLTGLAIKYS